MPLLESIVESLSPRRTFRLWKAALGLLSSVALLPLALRIKRVVAAGGDEKTLRVADIAYRSIAGEAELLLDVYRARARSVRPSKKVYVFIYGGAWGSGDKDMYTLLAMTLQQAEPGSIVVVPNYRTYPSGQVPDMMQDIIDAFVWTAKNITNFGGHSNPDVTLIGHSAGAHLVALACLHIARVGDAESFEALGKVVCLAGVFDIESHFQFEASRGVEWISHMHRAFGGVDHKHFPLNFREHSPSLLLLKGAHDPSRFDPIRNIPWHIVHGSCDGTVPSSSSVGFHEALKGAKFNAWLHVVEGMDHSAPVTDLMTSSMQSDHAEGLLAIIR